MSPHPWITVAPDRKGGDACIAGQNFRVEMIAEMWACGNRTLEDLEKDYEFIDRDVVLLSCWYQSLYGTLRWRKAWRTWGEMWGWRLWSAPMPPQFLSGRLTEEEVAKQREEEYRVLVERVKAESAPYFEIDSRGSE